MKTSGFLSKTLPLALFVTVLLGPLRAQVDPPESGAAATPGIFTLYFENDYFGGEDQHYTNGFKLSWLSSDLRDWGQSGWRKKALEVLPFINDDNTQKNIGFAFGQNIYTPQDISAVPPDPTDRPYAGWSYLELSFLSKTARRLDIFSVQLGMVGRHSYAQDTQTVIHEWLNDEEPRGWDYQLKDEFGVNLTYERRLRLYAASWGEFLGVDFIPHLGASVGNVQTYANAGASVRLGFHLPDDFGVDLIRAGGAVNGPIDPERPRAARWSFFVFGGVDGRAVARDIFLDGNTWRDSPSVDKENFVADAYYGIGAAVGKWRLTYTEVMRTREFEAQDRKSYFGSVALSRLF